MRFDYISLVMNPFVLMFLAIFTGLIFGKIKFGKFTFGTSGALFTGLAIGYVVYDFSESIIAQGKTTFGYNAAQALISNGVISPDFFNMALIFFVAAVGLLAAKDMGAVLKKYGMKFIVLGILITFIGAGATYAATLFDLGGANTYEITGVYTGALTSSPGLGAAIETAKTHSADYANDFENQPAKIKEEMLSMIDSSGGLTTENTKALTEKQKAAYAKSAEAGVGVGYAIGYPFGVIIVIFAVNFFAQIFKMDIDEEKRRFDLEMMEARKAVTVRTIPDGPFSMIAFSITCVVGYVLGSVEIYLGPLGYFSLGATGGVLIVGLFFGYIGKIGPLSFRMNPKILSVIREIGLAFFLAIVGLKYGYKAVDALMGAGAALAAASLAIGIIAMLSGFIVGRYAFKLNWIMLAGAICGGMTSTPGLGAAIDALKSDDPAAGYGATYPFALLGMVMFTIILHKLPIL